MNGSSNKDLVWELDSLNYRERAHEFILKLQNYLCVYSSSVEQMYTNFEILMPKEENHNLVILPNPYAYHDTYNSIPERAIKATGLHIVPGENGLLLIIPLKKGSKNYRAVPLKVGLKLINNRRPPNKPIMPVLMKGDLREFNTRYPTVHLHAISEAQLQHISQLEIASIRQVISERLDALVISKLTTSFDGVKTSPQSVLRE